MKPVLEQAVIDSLAQGRFDGELDGYVIMDGPSYLGHALYRVSEGVTWVLECSTAQNQLVDGAVRACVAAGENAGATAFALNEEDAALKKWREVFFKQEEQPIPNSKLFQKCK
jgi:hypothetical protein